MTIDQPVDDPPASAERRPLPARPARMAGPWRGPGRHGPASRLRHGSRWYSRFVRVAKIALPALALGLLVSALAWPQLRQWLAPPVAFGLPFAPQGGDRQMTAPRYFGVDELNRPYSITGRSGNQNTPGAEVMTLDDPEAEMTLADGTWATVRARHAQIDRQRGEVRLSGDVNVFRDDGYAFSTEEVFVDMNSRVTWGDRPVEVHGPRAEVTAQGFRIQGEGNTVVFTGQTRILLRPAPEGSP